jgi:hypothetical protein
MSRRIIAALSVAALSATLVAGTDAPADGPADVVVIAVVDSSFSPYHLDFRADRMPQHLDADPSNDLPLGQAGTTALAPHEWIPDFPDPSEAFAEYRRLDLTLPDQGPIAAPYNADIEQWNAVKRSTPQAVNFYWAPGTKAVGMVDFSNSGNGFRLPGGASHGMGSASVSAGAIHGACPECVVVFIPYGTGSNAESASNWAYSQPWIDVVTNSFGFSLLLRDRFYNGGNAEQSKAASERGQTIFFSAGNGQANTFTAPNTTIFSSQEGPDWMVTVGAIDPNSRGSYTGHGKPVDISSIGTGYPSARSSGSTTVDGKGTFGGTSNATPVTAGTYARALWLVRSALSGGKQQSGGVIASGDPVDCDGCALEDGLLTQVELREALFDTAEHTDVGYDPIGLVGGEPALPITDPESEFVTEGHGSLFGRVHGDEAWLQETEDTAALVLGLREPTGMLDGEAEWFVVDSFCRQTIWGTWSGGHWSEGGPLPGPDPMWPMRTALEQTCPFLTPIPGT